MVGRNGVQQRRNSWQDGVYGTNCPIPPGKNFTYVLQVKDQIGTYFYFPSLALHKAAGGFGGIKVASRSVIPVPFPPPAGDYTILAGDWFKQNHTVSSLPRTNFTHPIHMIHILRKKMEDMVCTLVFDKCHAEHEASHMSLSFGFSLILQNLRAILDGGNDLPFPDGLLINGRGSNGFTFTVDQGNSLWLAVKEIRTFFYTYGDGVYIIWLCLKLVGQVRLTGSGYRMWGWRVPSISESRGIKCCW